MFTYLLGALKFINIFVRLIFDDFGSHIKPSDENQWSYQKSINQYVNISMVNISMVDSKIDIWTRSTRVFPARRFDFSCLVLGSRCPSLVPFNISGGFLSHGGTPISSISTGFSSRNM
jgi:hypothetical protein